MKRRRMKKFRLHEISFVDNPAQEHALAVMMKRDDATLFYKTSEPTPVESKPTLSQSPSLRTSEPERKSNMPNSFEEAVGIIRREQPHISRTQALSAAREGYPSLFKSYQESPAAGGPSAAVEKSEAVQTFEKTVSEVQARDRCSRIEALRKAAREYPNELSAYRTALT